MVPEDERRRWWLRRAGGEPTGFRDSAGVCKMIPAEDTLGPRSTGGRNGGVPIGFRGMLGIEAIRSLANGDEIFRCPK